MTHTLVKVALSLSALCTIIGLGFSFYNYYYHGDSFFNTTTRGLLFSFLVVFIIFLRDRRHQKEKEDKE